jgi:TPP-dependent trihydroxycyclohexane-1,2-dione (THcHDO) dehydratase
MVQRQDTVALAPFTWHVFTHYQSAAAKKGHVLATASDCHMAADLPGVLHLFSYNNILGYGSAVYRLRGSLPTHHGAATSRRVSYKVVFPPMRSCSNVIV